jgi:hypothetical protein
MPKQTENRTNLIVGLKVQEIQGMRQSPGQAGRQWSGQSESQEKAKQEPAKAKGHRFQVR